MQSYLHIKIGLIAIVNSKTKLSQKMAHDTLLYTANNYMRLIFTLVLVWLIMFTSTCNFYK